MTHDRKTLDEYIFEHWPDVSILAENGPEHWTNDQYLSFYDRYSREVWDLLYDEYTDGIRYNNVWACPSNFLAWIGTIPAANDVEDSTSFIMHISRHALMIRASDLLRIDPE